MWVYLRPKFSFWIRTSQSLHNVIKVIWGLKLWTFNATYLRRSSLITAGKPTKKTKKNCYIPICTRQPWNCGLQYAVNLDLKVFKSLNRIWKLCTLKYSLKMLFHALYSHCLFRSVALLHTGTRIKPKPIINKVTLINKTSSNKRLQYSRHNKNY